MRTFILITAMSLLTFSFACNSQEGSRVASKTTQTGDTTQKAQTPRPAQTAPNSLDSARRITAEELHKLWQKDEVLIVDTRNEPSFKQGHIKGSILIPANEFSSRADELPKNKMIVTYCT